MRTGHARPVGRGVEGGDAGRAAEVPAAGPLAPRARWAARGRRRNWRRGRRRERRGRARRAVVADDDPGGWRPSSRQREAAVVAATGGGERGQGRGATVEPPVQLGGRHGRSVALTPQIRLVDQPLGRRRPRPPPLGGSARASLRPKVAGAGDLPSSRRGAAMPGGKGSSSAASCCSAPWDERRPPPGPTQSASTYDAPCITTLGCSPRLYAQLLSRKKARPDQAKQTVTCR